MARDRDLQGLRILLAEEFVRWDDVITVRVKKKAPAEHLVSGGGWSGDEGRNGGVEKEESRV